MDTKKTEATKDADRIKNQFLSQTLEIREKYKRVLLDPGEATRFDVLYDLLEKFDNTPFLDAPVTSASIEEYRKTYIDNTSPDFPTLSISAQKQFDLSVFKEPLVNSKTSQFKDFLTKVGSEQWFRDAYERFSKNGETQRTCPYCQQQLPFNFDDIVSHAFDETYQKGIEKIKKTISDIKEHSELISKQLSDLVKSRWADETLYKDFLVISDLIKSIIDRNEALMNNKVEDPSRIIELEDLNKELFKARDLIAENNRRATKLNSLKSNPKAAKQRGKEMLMSYLKVLTAETVATYKAKKREIDILNLDDKSIKDKSSDEIKMLNLEKEKLRLQLTDTGTTVNRINTLLKNSGFTGFHLEEIDRTTHRVQIIRDRTNAPAKRLSEGEKNFLMFLYFYFTVKGSSDPSGAIKNKIVIIDNPVTSMDSNALLIISTLTRELGGICENNYKLEDAITGDDYIKQIFLLSHNPYFFRATTDEWIDEYEYTNYFYVHKENNKSKITLKVEINPNNPTEERNAFPVKNAYNALWDQYNSRTCDPVSLMNAARQILEHYFIQTCKTKSSKIRKVILEDNKPAFLKVDENGREDTSDYNTVSSLLSCLTNSLDDDFAYDASAFSTEAIRTNFKKIFEMMGELDHYRAMVK